ncbi:hypothetical protein AMECASPLE_037255 [Ameca splendens]|uniref:Uncharacterized protein n=1 Tax=Ameca splendens TaxID=208324 RepID=A0ABV0XWR1_9TELE
MAAAWRPRRGGRKRGTVVLYRGRTADKGCGHPGALFWTITLPVDKVLPTPTLPTEVHNPSYCIDWVPINEPGGWRGFGWRAQWTGLNGLDLGHMESRVNPKAEREAKMDCVLTDD